MTKRTVLVVDDDGDLRSSLCDALAFEGYRTLDAANGREALERLHRDRADLIVLDLMMPVMNGWQFREQQLAEPALAKIPVVVLTAMGGDRPPIDANVVIAKPVPLEQLLDAVARYAPADGG